MQEQNKLERRHRSRQQKEEREKQLFELKQQKRKEKHKGIKSALKGLNYVSDFGKMTMVRKN